MRFLRFVLAAALACAAHPALAEWHEAKTRHFVVYSEQKPAELRKYAEELERFDQGVRKLRGMADPELTDAGRLRIYVLRTQNSVATLVGDPSSSVAGFYITRASGALAFVHRENSFEEWELSARTVFFHEYLHHLMLQEMNVALPAWIVEGSAELFATARSQKDGALVFGYAPTHRAYGLFNLSGLTLQEMVGAKSELKGDEWEQLYGRGWLLTHMLTFSDGRRGQIGKYVEGIQRGLAPLDAGKAAFGDLRLLERDLSRYLTKSRLTGVTVPAHLLQPGPIALRRLSAGEEAILPVVMRSERGVGPKTAPRVLADAQRVAARFPNDPVVLAALAEALQDAGDNAAAVAAADRALAVDPRAGKAMIMKARAQLALAAKAPDKADWKAIRALIAQANKLDPEHAEPLMLFYRSFLQQGMKPTPNSVEGLLYAQALVPQDDSLRMMAVQQLISDGKLPTAQRMFSPIAYNPHAGGERTALLEIMAALGAGKGDEAMKLIGKLGDEEPKTEAAR